MQDVSERHLARKSQTRLHPHAYCGLVHRLAYNGDVAAGQLAVFQGGPSRTGGKAPISGLIRVKRATRKNSQLAAARRVALKMGRRPRCSSVTSRTIFVPAGENQIGA